jgi:hypothetical protein
VVNEEGISMRLLKMFVRLIILACFVVGMAGCGEEPKKGTTQGTAQDKVSAPPVKPSQKKVDAAE